MNLSPPPQLNPTRSQFPSASSSASVSQVTQLSADLDASMTTSILRTTASLGVARAIIHARDGRARAAAADAKEQRRAGAGVAFFCDGKIPGGEIDRNGWMDGWGCGGGSGGGMGQKRERRGGRTEQKMNKPRFGAKAETLRGLTETDWPIGRGEVQVQSVNVGERKRPRPTSPPHFVLFYFLALPSPSRRERGGRRGPAALISTPQPTEPTNQPKHRQCFCASVRLLVAIRQSASLTPSPSANPHRRGRWFRGLQR